MEEAAEVEEAASVEVVMLLAQGVLQQEAVEAVLQELLLELEEEEALALEVQKMPRT